MFHWFGELTSVEVGVTIAWGTSMGLWSLGSLVAVQVGYLGGVWLRSALEHVGIAEPIAPPRHRH